MTNIYLVIAASYAAYSYGLYTYLHYFLFFIIDSFRNAQNQFLARANVAIATSNALISLKKCATVSINRILPEKIRPAYIRVSTISEKINEGKTEYSNDKKREDSVYAGA